MNTSIKEQPAAIDMFGISSLNEDDKIELIRKSLDNLTTSYSDEADVFTEIIQNAVDAIVSRCGSSDGGELMIVIGRRKGHAHYLYVQDNGSGMSADVVDKVFIPGFSKDKIQGKAIGYKGVGMSYVVAVSDHIAIRSVKDGNATERTVLRTNDWIRDSEKPQPEVSASFLAPEPVRSLAGAITTGTGVYFSFHAGSDPSSLDTLVLVSGDTSAELNRWAAFLCARTPLGLATSRAQKVTSPIKVRFLMDRGGGDYAEREFERSEYDIANAKLGYPFPEAVFRVGIDTADIERTPPGQQITKHARTHQAVFHEWTGEELANDLGDLLSAEEKTLLLTHLGWVRGYLCYSTDVLKTVKERMGTRSAVIRYGAKLAVDGVPQGRPLELALTSDQGLERQTHIVLGFNELQLDTGRKFVSNEKALSAINIATQRVVTKLKNYRWALKVKDKAPVEADLGAWIKAIDGRAGNSVIALLFEGEGLTPPARVDPDNEQEVIALWTALITTGLLPGFNMKAVSGFNRYDALINVTAAAFASHGLLAAIATDEKPKDNSVLEFKWSFDSLITDFEEQIKKPNEIDYVVCWDCPDLNLRKGALKPVYGVWSHERPARAVSYVWSDDANSTHFNVIALKNVIAEILATKGQAAGKAALAVLENRDREKLI